MKKASDIDPLDRTFSLESLKGKGERGKYLSRISKGSNLVRLSPEVAQLFPTEAAVNNALLSLAELSRKLPELVIQPKRVSRKRAAA
jgi:hypothetical protein